MDKHLQHLQEKLLSIANRLSQNFLLTALRNAFAGILPLLMTGSFALLTNTAIDKLGLTQLHGLFQINQLVFNGSVGLASLFLAYSLGTSIAKHYEVEPLQAGLVSVGGFFIAMGTSLVHQPLTIQSLLSAKGYWTALIMGFLAAFLYCLCSKHPIKLKLPDAVPPAVSTTLTESIPSLVSLYLIAILSFTVHQLTGQTLLEGIYHSIQIPLMALFQQAVPVVLLALFLQLFWFVGIHGGNVFAPLMEGVFGLAMVANMVALSEGKPIPYLWTNHSYGAFVWYGVMGMIGAICLFSRKEVHRQIALSSAGSLFFNIGEGIMYGIPIVLNPIFFIPYLLCPALLTAVSYWATASGWVAPVTQQATWITPPFLYGFIATGFDPRSLLLSAVNLLIATLIYIPFVKWADKSN